MSGRDDGYACGTAARWLPRVLAASLLVSGWLLVVRLGPDSTVPGARSVRGLVVVAAALVALWIVRKGGELRLRLRVTDDGLRFEHRSHSAELPFEAIESVRYEAPFAGSRVWLPAAVLVDSQDRSWRVSALLDGGDRLFVELVRRSGREDLAAWVDAHRVIERMGRSAWRVRLGYALVATIFLGAAAYAVG